jgi:hypothetical protein
MPSYITINKTDLLFELKKKGVRYKDRDVICCFIKKQIIEFKDKELAKCVEAYCENNRTEHYLGEYIK